MLKTVVIGEQFRKEVLQKNRKLQFEEKKNRRSRRRKKQEKKGNHSFDKLKFSVENVLK